MIRSASIRGFRCLHEVDLDLEPLTVLVGHNASGKSSVLAALEGRQWDANDVSFRRAGTRASIELRCDDGNTWARYVKADGQGAQASGHAPTFQILHLDLAQLRASQPASQQHQLQRNGGQLVNVFASCTRKEQSEVAAAFCARVPVFQDVIVRPSQQGHQRLQFQDRWNDAIWYEPHQVSDGSILVLAYTLLAQQHPAPDVIAIEEPERGLHPHLLGEVIAALKDLTERPDHPIQVILATHSAELLAHVEPSEVRFLARDEATGGTIVRKAPIDQPGWDEAVRAYENSIGQMWLAGVVGGAAG